MRLIDADAFINYLGLDCENSREENIGEVVTLEDFDRQPTAYDVNKIVEKLSNLLKNSTWNHNSDNISLKSAIEIVKEG